MTKKDLIELLKEVPENAKIYISSAHTNVPEQANFLGVTYTGGKLPFYGSDIQWENMAERSKITAVLIS